MMSDVEFETIEKIRKKSTERNLSSYVQDELLSKAEWFENV